MVFNDKSFRALFFSLIIKCFRLFHTNCMLVCHIRTNITWCCLMHGDLQKSVTSDFAGFILFLSFLLLFHQFFFFSLSIFGLFFSSLHLLLIIFVSIFLSIWHHGDVSFQILFFPFSLFWFSEVKVLFAPNHILMKSLSHFESPACPVFYIKSNNNNRQLVGQLHL